MDLMPIVKMDDWEKRLDRQDAFWDRAILDRPVVCMELPRYHASTGLPAAGVTVSAGQPAAPERPSHTHVDQAQLWTDVAYQAELARWMVGNTEYLGDALPYAFPNLGPDYFAACFGGSLRFMEDTSYIEPFLDDWSALPALVFDRSGFAFQTMERLYDTFLDAGVGEFYVGYPDIHPGADCLVGFRGPLEMNYDVLEHQDSICTALKMVTDNFITVYNHYFDKLAARGQAVTTWAGIVSRRKWHIACSDFSCMISTPMFEELFLPSLVEEMKPMERNIYHLDGPGALRHLDSLLAIKELDAVQWIPGAGNGGPADHIEVYRRIQAAGKGIQILDAAAADVDSLVDNLSPEGVWLRVVVGKRDEAEWVMKKVEAWR
jgi:hypothetical protein